MFCWCVVFFKQKTAYEMRISDWSSDVCSSDLLLSEMLGVSRNAVREAIKRLQQARLVEVKHGGTTTVLDYRIEAGADLLPSLLFNREGQIQVDVARSIVRMRQIGRAHG